MYLCSVLKKEIFIHITLLNSLHYTKSMGFRNNQGAIYRRVTTQSCQHGLKFLSLSTLRIMAST